MFVTTGQLFIHTHPEFGSNISLGLLLQPPLHELSAVLTIPNIPVSITTDPSAQLGIRAPLGEATSIHKKTGSGSRTTHRCQAGGTQRSEEMP